MRNFFKASIIFIIWVLIAFIWHKTVHPSHKINAHEVVKSSTHKTILQGNDTIAKTAVFKAKPLKNIQSDFIIFKNKNKITTPSNFIETVSSITEFLTKNSSHKIIIISKYLASEKDKEMPLNYGIIRGVEVKNKLINAGVNPVKIFIKDTLAHFQFNKDSAYKKGMELKLIPYTKLENEAKKAQVLHKTLYAYFGNKNFNYDTSLKSYILNLNHFIIDNPTARIIVEGHTDNQGPIDGNYWVGLQRAQNVKHFLLKKGIPAKNITAISKGEIEPIANNKQKEGRILNRRIEIYIQ